MSDAGNSEPAIPCAPRRDPSEYRKGEEVALFVPCYVDQFFPVAALAAARLLDRLGVAVVYPERQTCCGQPAFNSGHLDEARQVVRHFCDVFRPYRYIVTPSGSCAAMCRVFFAHLDEDERVVGVGRRVYELTEFLVDVLGVTDTGAACPRAVTLHLGCHTRRELGVVEQPRRLLQNVEGLDLRPLPDAGECCGFGGTFSVKMPALSLSMGRAKVDRIVQSGAEVVASPDMSCLMQIGGILQRTAGAGNIRIKHIAELLVAEEGRA
jgi:L-lactate dehydrogenase complex protein LldE